MSSEATSGEPAHPTMLIPGRALLFDCDGVLRTLTPVSSRPGHGGRVVTR